MFIFFFGVPFGKETLKIFTDHSAGVQFFTGLHPYVECVQIVFTALGNKQRCSQHYTPLT